VDLTSSEVALVEVALVEVALVVVDVVDPSVSHFYVPLAQETTFCVMGLVIYRIKS